METLLILLSMFQPKLLNPTYRHIANVSAFSAKRPFACKRWPSIQMNYCSRASCSKWNNETEIREWLGEGEGRHYLQRKEAGREEKER